MSYHNPRIQLTDTTMSVVIKMSEGNPGAMQVLKNILGKAAAIDPDDAFGALGAILSLDTEDIYGSRIWMLYKDVAGQDLVNMLGLLRAVQLGYLTNTQLQHAIDHGVPEEGWVQHWVGKVKERLPAFGASVPA